ncbi:MAG TPA: HAD family hydrolase [Candidatus Omnitrophica bacterium]|nr:HAD family hydrolase [Candidatus Omnitrophota bacterium]
MEFEKEHLYFVSIDSDGCVFPTMEVKQKMCIHPEILRQWNLWVIEKEVRMVAEWVTLYSVHRGSNRFIALRLIFDLLREMLVVRQKGVSIPDTEPLQHYINSGIPVSSSYIREYTYQHPEMRSFLEWNERIDADIARRVKNVKPFSYVKKCLQRLCDSADCVVVSTTPSEALRREWKQNSLSRYVKLICGGEMGSKSEQIRRITEGKYHGTHILVIGDSPVDLKAAEENSACFFPITPGEEEESWEYFYRETLDKFLKGGYTQQYQNLLIEKFNKLLPKDPPWRTC